LQNILDELNEITKKLYRVETQEAMKKWKDVLERISIRIEGHNGDINQTDILELLQMITLAIQNKDYILMADLIRYELITLLSK
jgi:hypothetical protein